MIGLRKPGDHWILYTKRPWVRRPMIEVAIDRDEGFFWCSSKDELELVKRFLAENEIEVFEEFTIAQTSESPQHFYPPTNFIEGEGRECCVTSTFDESLLEELRGSHYLAILLNDDKWIIK